MPSGAFVPGVSGEVVDLAAYVQHGVAQCMVLSGPVGVRDDDLALRLGPRDVPRDGSTVVIPVPALASRSGQSEDWTTKSPAGALTSRT